MNSVLVRTRPVFAKIVPFLLLEFRIDYFTAVDNKSDDELSTGATVVINTVVTFISLSVTALITYIIISLYHKYHHEKFEVNDDKNVNTEQKDPNGGNISMDTNPAYATTIKMDTNPAYASTIKMDTNPAYATAN